MIALTRNRIRKLRPLPSTLLEREKYRSLQISESKTGKAGRGTTAIQTVMQVQALS